MEWKNNAFWGPLFAFKVLSTHHIRMLGQHYKVDLLSYLLAAKLKYWSWMILKNVLMALPSESWCRIVSFLSCLTESPKISSQIMFLKYSQIHDISQSRNKYVVFPSFVRCSLHRAALSRNSWLTVERKNLAWNDKLHRCPWSLSFDVSLVLLMILFLISSLGSWKPFDCILAIGHRSDAPSKIAKFSFAGPASSTTLAAMMAALLSSSAKDMASARCLNPSRPMRQFHVLSCIFLPVCGDTKTCSWSHFGE